MYDPKLGYDPIEEGNKSVMGAPRLVKKTTTPTTNNTNFGIDLSLNPTAPINNTKKVDPIGVAIAANPGYKSPAQIAAGNNPVQVTPSVVPTTTSTVVQPTVVQPTVVNQPTTIDTTITDMMEKARKAQIDAAISNLQSRYASTIGDINQKVTQITPTYDAKRLQEQSQSALQGKNFAEYLANRGQSTSGYSNQSELMRNLGLQQNIGALNTQQGQEETYYKNLQDQAQSALNRDIAAAEAGSNASYMDNFMKYLTEQESLKKKSDLERELTKMQVDQRAAESLQASSDKEAQRIAESGQNAAKIQAEKDQNKIKNTGYIEPQYNGTPVSQIKIRQDIQDQLAPYSNDYAQAAINFGKQYIYTVPQEMQSLLKVEIPQDIKDTLAQYGNNYAQASKDYLANGNIEMSNWAKVASAQKMNSDPTLLEKYGVRVQNPQYNPDLSQAATILSQQKMFQNPGLLQAYGQQYLSQEGLKNYYDNQKTIMDTVGLQLNNITNQTKLQYLEPQLAAQLLKDQEAVRKAQIENKFLPQQQQSEIDQRIAQAQATIYNAETGRINANTNIYQAETGRMSANASIQNAANNYALNQQKAAQAQGNTSFNQGKALVDGYVKSIDEQYVTNESKKQLDAAGNEIPGGGTTTKKTYDYNAIDKATQSSFDNGEDLDVINDVRRRYNLTPIKLKK